MKLKILFEDDSIIVAVKPCGVPSQDDRTNSESMLSMLKLRMYENNNLNSEPYLTAIHRLDRPVSGIMVFAKTKDAAAALSAQSEQGIMEKYYQAVLTGQLPDDMGELNDYLYHDRQNNITTVVSPEAPEAKYASLSYEVLDIFETDRGVLSYVLIKLNTGRHHQIRVQMAHAGAGIYGDKKYNPSYNGNRRQNGGNTDTHRNEKYEKNSHATRGSGHEEMALHASRLELNHPITGEHMIFKDEPMGGAFEIIELEEF